MKKTNEVLSLEKNKPAQRTLKTGEIHAYSIELEAGEVLDAAVNKRGIDVVVSIFGPDGVKLAENGSPDGGRGVEPIELEAGTAGTYRVHISPIEDEGNSPAGHYEITVNDILSADQYAKRLAEKKRKQQAVIAWLKKNAVSIKTVEAGNGFEDMQPLKRILKDARFVGLGEATHGTREFFQFKHRMLEFLVKEMDFRVFAIEASYSACQNINDYVMGRTSDGAAALDSQGFWTWRTEEVLALMDWMRDYNTGVGAEKKVKFAGFDIQVNNTGKTRLLEYLHRITPERAARTEDFFKTSFFELINDSYFQKGKKAREARAKLAALKDKYNDLFIFLELRGAELAEKSGRDEYEQMLEYARVILQEIDTYSSPELNGSAAARDLYMADNLRRIANREPAGTRFVLWGHNGHIAMGDKDGTYPTFGCHLRRFYGKDYYALGFSFNQGAFQAWEAQPKDPLKSMLISFTVNPASVDSIDWYLAQTGVKSFIVDFRSPGKDAALKEWLDVSRPMRSVGSMYAPDFEKFTHRTVINKEFDGLFFIDTTTRARPNPSVKNVG